MSGNYQAADANALQVPTTATDAGVLQCLGEIKSLLVTMNHNLATVITQVGAQQLDLSTADASLKNHDNSITNLDALMIRMMADLSRLSTGTGASGSGTTTGGSTSRRLKIAEPAKFDGTDKNKAVSFRVAVSHYIRVSYPGSPVEDQIAYIISALDGKAHEWLEPYLEKDVILNDQVSWLHDIDAFWEQFNARWNVQNKTENYRAKFKTLKQTKSVQEYFKDFQTYSQNLGYNDVSLRDFFYDGLSVKVKEILMAQDFDHGDSAVSLQILADRAMKIDQRLEQFAAQNKGTSTSSGNQGSKAGTSTSSAAQGAPREKLSVGEKVYQIGPDGKAKKGTITSIGKNAKGFSIPMIKWNDGSSGEATFKSIKKDDHPVVAPTGSKPPKNSGPTPMDLDAAGKGKKPITCNTCGGRGHYANQCPSKPYSGQEAHISDEEEGSENEDL